MAADIATVQVAVGILLDHDSRLFVARRTPGSHLEDLWEFPGGKVETGESFESALERELREEVGIELRSASCLHRESHDYADRRVLIEFFLCGDWDGEASGKEGQDVRWVTLAELSALPTPAANASVMTILQDRLL